jgi:DNA (cytosine-5)-methyltransferase 1
MTHGSLFSGIGGFDLAAEWMGWDNVFHCEWNKFGQQVLKYYWPNSISYDDITKTDFTIHRGKIDIITGGFPCQPYSSAGKRLGKEDERHLWPEMLRTIREVQPRWVVGENVLGLVNWSGGLVFHEVQADLEAEGYEVQPYVLPAVSVNAPHRRDRVWFVAYFARSSERANQLSGIRCQDGEVSGERSQTFHDAFRPDGVEGDVTNPNLYGCNERNSNDEINPSEGRINALGDPDESAGDGYAANTMCNRSGESGDRGQPKQLNENGIERGITSHSPYIRQEYALEDGKLEGGRFRESNKRNMWDSFPSISPICTGDDGLSKQLDSITFPKWRNESIKAGGNAIVPQVVYQIFKTIEQYEREHPTR